MSRIASAIFFLTTTTFVCIMVVVNLAHPIMHHFEGGTIDATVDYLTALAAQTASTTRRT